LISIILTSPKLCPVKCESEFMQNILQYETTLCPKEMDELEFTQNFLYRMYVFVSIFCFVFTVLPLYRK
jgi:hypothetical protein